MGLQRLWRLPARGASWLLRQMGKWMEESGRIEAMQWGIELPEKEK